jgi:hypothetical protein
MDELVKHVLTSVSTGAALGVLTWLWLKFSAAGQSFWTTWGKTAGLQSIAVVAITALIVALGVLSATVYYRRAAPVVQPLIAAEWDGQKISFTSAGANLTGELRKAAGLIRIGYDSYNFLDRPIVMISSGRDAKAWALETTNRYVDIKEQLYAEYGQLNGAATTEKPFSIFIIPPVRSTK